MMLPAFEAFRDHAHEQAPLEACGVIAGDVYFPCRNVTEGDPKHSFSIHAGDQDSAEDAGPIQAICHSHTGPATPSDLDRERCSESGVPWFILGQGDEMQRLDPALIPLTERPFLFGWSDCWSLVRDYYGGLPDFPREDKFWELGHSPFTEQFSACGFREVSLVDALPGDALLMRFRSHVIPNHAGILLNDGWLLHHPRNLFSRVDLLTPYLGRISHVLRRNA